MTSTFMVCESAPCFVEQRITSSDQEGWVFESKISPLVGKTDKLFNLVTQYLNLFCSSVLSESTREDASMMFGEATTTRYRLHQRCPGSTTPHRCKGVQA